MLTTRRDGPGSGRFARGSAFTLVELLVVVAILSLLAMLLAPSLRRAVELTRRTTCNSDVHQVLLTLTTYAARNDAVLPSGKRNAVSGYRGEHCIWISDELHDLIAESGSESLMTCLSFDHGFGYQNQYGWVIGYNYLGNHPRMNELGNFTSAIRMTESGGLPLWTDLNNWNPGWTFVAHTDSGAAGIRAGGPPHYPKWELAGSEPEALGSEGGNVGYLDGSARWRDLGEMEVHPSSEWPGNYPCLW